MNVGYVRLSRDDDKRNYVSIENQMLMIRQYAAEQGVAIDRWYEDDGVSGYVFDRPGFNRLMADLDRDIDTVFVKDFSRLGRHNAKVLLLLDEFQERGKRLIVIDDAYDSFGSDDDTIGIKTWYNERYVKDTSRKIRRALGARQKEGTLMTQPPFGYRRNKKDKARIEVVPGEAEYVKMIYDLYLQGSGYRRIAAYLTENHVPTPSMARRRRELEEGRPAKRRIASEWSDGMVKELLDNDFYIGTFRLHKRERAAIHGKDRRVPREQQHVFSNHHPPIIDQMTFDLVQETKAKRSREHYRGSPIRRDGTEPQNPFESCLFCRDCGSRLTPILRRTSSRERKYYICSAYNTKGSRYCSKAHLIEEQDLMGDIIHYVQFCRTSLRERIAAYNRKDLEPAQSSAREKRGELQKRIAGQKRQLKTLFSQKVMDSASNPDRAELIREAYDSLQQDILADIRRLELRLEELDHVNQKKDDAGKRQKTALEVMDGIIQKGILDRRDIEILVDRITVDKNGMPEIEFKYGLSALIQHSPAKELNQRENAILYTAMKLILEEHRGYTSAKYLSAKLTEAGYQKSRKSILPYIGLMIEMGMITPSGNPRKPYTIIKTPSEIRKLMDAWKPPQENCTPGRPPDLKK